MPTYDASAASVDKPVLTPGRSLLVWDNETVPASAEASPPEESASQQVSLHRDQNFPSCLSVEVEFFGAPGSFEVELQTADTDDEDYYVTKSSLTAVNTANIGRLEVVNVVAKFARLRMKTKANAVAVTARIS